MNQGKERAGGLRRGNIHAGLRRNRSEVTPPRGRLLNISDDADDFAGFIARRQMPADDERLVLVIAIDERLVDNGDTGRRGPVAFQDEASVTKRYLQRLEISG